MSQNSFIYRVNLNMIECGSSYFFEFNEKIDKDTFVNHIRTWLFSIFPDDIKNTSFFEDTKVYFSFDFLLPLAVEDTLTAEHIVNSFIQELGYNENICLDDESINQKLNLNSDDPIEDVITRYSYNVPSFSTYLKENNLGSLYVVPVEDTYSFSLFV